jgi:hypothetical protein
MTKNKKYYFAYSVATVQTTTYAGIRWEPEPTDDDGSDGVPDWVAYLVLMVVVLIMFGKLK